MDPSTYTEVTTTVVSTPGQGYGFEIDGSRTPLRISAISKDSPSSRAGLRKDDYLLMVNGHMVMESPLSVVQAIISYGTGSPLTMKIARTNEQSKQQIPPSNQRNTYQQTVGEAVRSVQDAFDILGLTDGPPGEMMMSVESVHRHDDEGDLSSPPTTSPDQSDQEEEPEYDPLLDFTKGSDEYTHESQVHFSAAMVGGVIRAQQALQGIKKLSEATKEKEPNHTKKVSTQASIEIKRRPNTKPPIKPTVKDHDAPPPIPPYKPDTPDNFLLSNKAEYQMDLKRQQHSYEVVSLDRQDDDSNKVVLRNKKQQEKNNEETFIAMPISRKPPLIPPRIEPESQPVIPVIEPVKPVIEPVKPFIEPVIPVIEPVIPVIEPVIPVIEPVKPDYLIDFGNLDPLKACDGLPSSVHTWKSQHALRWLNQLDINLSNLYSSCFKQHCVTGHTILHLNQSKLHVMGIENKEHRLQLGMAIAKLRLHHEHKELEMLTSQVSWL